MKIESASAVNGHQGQLFTQSHRKCTWKIFVLQSGAEVITCEFSLKYLAWKIEFIYLITKYFCSNVNEPVSGETLFSGRIMFGLLMISKFADCFCTS